MLKKIIAWSTAILAILMAITNVAGIFYPKTYSLEAPGWIIQAIGQDLGTLLIVIPLLIVSGILAYKGSIKGFLIWIGLLLYIIYAYIIYAFFIHFNFLFLIYVLILSITFYSLVFATKLCDLEDIASSFSAKAPLKLTSRFLIGFALIFASLWLSEIIPAVIRGEIPKSIIESGIITNPIYVLDLALFFPGVALIGFLLKRKNLYGYFFAIPILVFSITMGLPSMGAAVAMVLRGMELALPPIIVMGGVSIICAIILFLLLKNIKSNIKLH